MNLARRVAALALLLLVPPRGASASSPAPLADPALAEVEAARALREIGDLRGAAKALDQALELEPDCAAAWLERGLLEEMNGSSTFARTHARSAFARAFELDPAFADPLRHPEILGSRAALAVRIASWRLPASAERVASTAVAVPPSAPAASRLFAPPVPRRSQTIDASDLAGTMPVNQVLPAGAGAGAQKATGRRGARTQRFHPTPVAPPEPEPMIENNEEAPPAEESGDAAAEAPSEDTSNEAAPEEPPPGAY